MHYRQYPDVRMQPLIFNNLKPLEVYSVEIVSRLMVRAFAPPSCSKSLSASPSRIQAGRFVMLLSRNVIKNLHYGIIGIIR